MTFTIFDLIYSYKVRPETPTINEGAAYTKNHIGLTFYRLPSAGAGFTFSGEW